MKMTVFMTNNIFVVNSIMLSSKFLFSGLVVGIFLVYLFFNTPEVVCKTITPDNVHNINFKDTEENNCYSLEAVETKCK